MIYALITDANGNGIGVHSYAEAPASYPTMETPCTPAQAANPTFYSVVNGAVVQALTPTQAAQIAYLTAACQASILAGYTSSALGTPHTYPTGLTDQINMLGSVASSQLPNLPSTWTTPFMCADSTGRWAMKPHTAAQIQQAGDDGKLWIQLCRLQLASMRSRIAAATTVAEVAAIVWQAP